MIPLFRQGKAWVRKTVKFDLLLRNIRRNSLKLKYVSKIYALNFEIVLLLDCVLEFSHSNSVSKL